ncbi:hypothetical protein [Rufibacter latericius]|uniref:Uncharacterized protein n=1 Tax=Rufibacter latericius TaxID=2487040 RepID=A0A3M9MDC4_9BACT|nr:hypothetical protein [Rufibacter latericius]RNI23571.1 hypothetical protein EFB08_18755 [Rufibacter latericius]
MELLTNPNRFAPVPGRHRGQFPFFGAIFAILLFLFVAGVLYFTHITDFSSPEVTSAGKMENQPTLQNTRVEALVAGTSIVTTANLVNHPVFAPLLKQQPTAVSFR